VKAKGIPPKVRAEVLERSKGLCEIPHGPRIGRFPHRADHLHHILMRSQGGQHTPENLIAVCWEWHAYIHANPAISYEQGWLRRSGVA
jgi:5-methylcytosine-specific restriction endonuclease McrA